MVPKDWKRFGKLIAVRIVNKDINKNIQDCIELNFEYSNSKILYKSENIQNFEKLKEKCESLIDHEVDLYCHSELDYEPYMKFWYDIRKTNNKLHDIKNISKEWGKTGILESVLICNKHIVIKVQNWEEMYLVKEDNIQFC